MNEKQLERNLKSIGQTCFVKYFELFASTTIDKTDKIEILKKETDYTEKSCISRTGHAQSVIKAGRAYDALNMIIISKSPRVSEKTRGRAEDLLSELQ